MFDKEKAVGAAVAMMNESPVEDSKWNAQTMQEAKQLVEALTEQQWKTICEVIPLLAKPSTPDQKQAAREQQKQAQAQQEALKADFEQKRSTADAFRKEIHMGVSIPERYDFTIGEIQPLLDYAFHPLALHDGIYDIASSLFVMGFKRGRAYQKAKSEKKTDENRKKNVKIS